jgi:hypothetical protein
MAAPAAVLMATAMSMATGCDMSMTSDDTCGALAQFDGELYGAHGTASADGSLEQYSRWLDDEYGQLTIHVPAGDEQAALRAAMADVVVGWNDALAQSDVDLRVVLSTSAKYSGFICDDHAAIIVGSDYQGPSTEEGYSVEAGDVVVCMHSRAYVDDQWADQQGGNARVLRSSDCEADITRAVISLSPGAFETADGSPVDNRDALMRHVLAHETGHVLGLGHPRKATVAGVPMLMAATSDYDEVTDGDHLPTYGETEGLWCIYHDACFDDLTFLN